MSREGCFETLYHHWVDVRLTAWGRNEDGSVWEHEGVIRDVLHTSYCHDVDAGDLDDDRISDLAGRVETAPEDEQYRDRIVRAIEEGCYYVDDLEETEYHTERMWCD